VSTHAPLDLVVRNGRVIDPASHVDAVLDIGVSAGTVVLVESPINRRGRLEIDATGCTVVPGLIDAHVHLSSEFNGNLGHAMLARAGVTTAVDLAGPTTDVMDVAASSGVGLTVGCLQRMVPGELIPSADPSRAQIRQAIDAACESGALGAKILGGHFPLTPEACARVIEAANDLGVYVAFHAGTTETPGDTRGLREAITLTGANRLHLPHVNSYCRGTTDTPAAEALDALASLSTAPHIFTESYLAPLNGTWGDCHSGAPTSDRTRACLIQGGYPATEDGLEAAIVSGYCLVHAASTTSTMLVSGDDGVAVWRSLRTRVGVSFVVNPPEPRLLLATARTRKGTFSIDAIATDGGGIPRNDMVSSGLALIALGALTFQEWLQKVCVTPARVLGLQRKGRISPGSDADVVVIDERNQRVDLTIAGGHVVMARGKVRRAPTRWLSLVGVPGRASAVGLVPYPLNIHASGFYTGEGLKC
jgi:cytosine/adenosine deaminase-related metal-dependent hydrolase